MTAIHETAYPRIRSNLSDAELQELYTPTPNDLAFARRVTKSTGTELGLIVLLKTFQRLGYFPRFDELPPRLLNHIASALETAEPEAQLHRYEARSQRWRHLPLVREYLGITAFSDGGRRVLLRAMLDAARSKDILADIINVGIEALVHARYELPAFSMLQRAGLKARAQVNTGYYEQVSAALDDLQRATLLRLMTRSDTDPTSLWQRLKREPRQPTPKQLREHLTHTRWLQSLNTARQTLDGIPETKLQRFADEARAADISRMREMSEAKRLTLAVALIRVRTAQALDDLAEMFIRRMQKLHNKAKEELDEYRRQHQEETDALVALLERIVTGWQASDQPTQRLQTLDALIGPNADTIRERCEVHLAYAGNNYLPFLPRLFRAHRKTCLDVLAFLQPTSTSTDTTLEQAIRFVVQHRDTRTATLPIMGNGQSNEEVLDVSWIPPSWWKAVTGTSRREDQVATVDRKYLELCVLSCAMAELKSGDLCIAGSEHFSDDRDQLVTWEEYERLVESYCQQVGIAADATQFVHDLQKQLSEAIQTTDAAFPTNTSLTIKDGEPVLRRLEKQPEPLNFAQIDRLLTERLPECNIIDVLTDTEHWLHWTSAFGPLSGEGG